MGLDPWASLKQPQDWRSLAEGAPAGRGEKPGLGASRAFQGLPEAPNCQEQGCQGRRGTGRFLRNPTAAGKARLRTLSPSRKFDNSRFTKQRKGEFRGQTAMQTGPSCEFGPPGPPHGLPLDVACSRSCGWHGGAGPPPGCSLHSPAAQADGDQRAQVSRGRHPAEWAPVDHDVQLVRVRLSEALWSED